MQWDILVLVAALFSLSTYLILQCHLVKVIFGLALLSNAANLLILATSLSPEGKEVPILNERFLPQVDPLPQALILTAIVISLGVTAFVVVLAYRLRLQHGTNATDVIYKKRGPE